MKWNIDPIVAAIAISNFLKLVHDLANLNILNNRSDRNAAIAEKLLFETP